jgi:hypothetical protein
MQWVAKCDSGPGTEDVTEAASIGSCVPLEGKADEDLGSSHGCALYDHKHSFLLSQPLLEKM